MKLLIFALFIVYSYTLKFSKYATDKAVCIEGFTKACVRYDKCL